MKKVTESDIQRLNRDPLLFMGFLTLVVIVMYVVTLVNEPAVQEPVILVIFTTLLIIHIILHWLLYKIAEYSFVWVVGYLVVQGILAFTISMISGTVGMVFALFMGLIGESVGLLGIKRWGLLALAYYLTLSMISFTYFVGVSSIGWWALGTTPIVIFIVIYVTMYVRQSEARNQAQTLLIELEKANQQLSEYADRVEDLTIANERQRMARELHDTLSQGLAGLILQLEAADANLSSDNYDKARSIIQQSMGQARTTLESSRRAIDNLRQTDSGSIVEAIRLEAIHFTERTGIPCDLHLDLSQPEPETVREAILRSIVEALTNIALHADAKRVEITGYSRDDQLFITIKDNGKGFNPNAIPAGHYGLLGIRERIQLAGGRIEIDSAPQKGTTLAIQIPIDSSEK